METKPARPTPLIVGEVLFDCFPDGQQVLGGAPFNVAWHLQGFGQNPIFISRIGNDEAGERVSRQMEAWQMNLAGLQRDDGHPTGRVNIEMDDHGHRFEIVADQAYDHIDAAPLQELLQEQPATLLYCGTLALRSDTSRATISRLLDEDLPRFVDINLREPWWEPDTIHFILNGARWAKLNDQELRELAADPLGDEASLRQAIEDFRAQYALSLAVVTAGEKGAYFCTPTQMLFEPAPAPAKLVDTVGAGDAFTAVTLCGLLNDWPLHITLKRALAFASRICEERGATLNDSGIYQTFIKQWQTN